MENKKPVLSICLLPLKQCLIVLDRPIQNVVDDLVVKPVIKIFDTSDSLMCFDTI